jgi:XTP/dITP diphosphohydrolase
VSGRAARPVWIVATGNAGKVREFAASLAHLVTLRSASEEGVTTFPPEDGATYEENATLKATHVASVTGQVAVADDSGIEVDALGGEPGVHSARFGGDGLTDRERVALLLRRLRHVPDERRTARFVSAIVVAHPGGSVASFRGACEGTLLHAPRGEGGFGYDPVFRSVELGRTFGEATLAEKHAVSHRGRALEALLAWLQAPDAASFLRHGS